MEKKKEDDGGRGYIQKRRRGGLGATLQVVPRVCSSYSDKYLPTYV